MLLLGQGSYALASISVRDAHGDELLPRSVLQLGPDERFPWLSTSPSGWIAPPAPPHSMFGSHSVLPSDARRRLAAATSVASPDRNPDRPADDPVRPTARRLLKAGASASSSVGYRTSGGRPSTYGAGRWGTAASSVRRRAPVFAGTAAGVHFTGGMTSAPYYYGRRSVIHNTNLIVLTSSHFHNHNGYHHCGNTDAAAGPVYGGSTYDRFACKQATPYRTPTDLDRYELAEALALPPIPSAQWPLELTVHELLVYPPNATEGRAPPALLGFSTNDVSRVYTLLALYWMVVLFSVLSCAAFACFRCLAKMCAPSLASKPGSTMV